MHPRLEYGYDQILLMVWHIKTFSNQIRNTQKKHKYNLVKKVATCFTIIKFTWWSESNFLLDNFQLLFIALTKRVLVCSYFYSSTWRIQNNSFLETSRTASFCNYYFLNTLKQNIIWKKSQQLRTHIVNSTESNLNFCKLRVTFRSPCKFHSLIC